MTDNERRILGRVTDSRRSFLRKGAAASAAVLGSAGVATAQDDGDDLEFGDDLFVEAEASNAYIFRDQWNSVRPFTIASPVLKFQPDVPGVRDELWADYNTRAIRYLGTNEQVLFFPNTQATIGPFSEELNYVVDDDFVENDDFGPVDDEDEAPEIFLNDTPISELDRNEIRQIRPTIWAMEPSPEVLSDENLIKVRFSPIPEQEEERIWNQVRDDFFN